MKKFNLKLIFNLAPPVRKRTLIITYSIAVLPDNAYLSLGKRLHFRGPTLPVIAVATPEVGPAVLLFVEEVCQVLAIRNQFCPTISIKVSTAKVRRFLKCGGIREAPLNHGVGHPRVPISATESVSALHRFNATLQQIALP